MAWLQAYDPVVTRRDFGRAASAGFDNVRIFLRWEDVQPTSSSIDTATLGRLVDVADAAVETGVVLIVTLFVGHMSGVNWIPAWATGGTDGDRRFRVVSRGTSPPGHRTSKLVRGHEDCRRSGAGRHRHGERLGRAPRSMGMGSRKRELQLHRSTRTRRRGGVAGANGHRSQE